MGRKLRINCDKFISIIQTPDSFGWYSSLEGWKEIKPNSIDYDLANYFCFATGAEGYTRELEEPEWVSKIIGNIEMKKIMKKRNLEILIVILLFGRINHDVFSIIVSD